jgi:predicted ATPase
MERKDFASVSSKVVEMLHGICMGSPLKKADDWIRNKHYTLDRLNIEHLSGEALSMNQRYINLSIIEEPRKKHHYTGKDLNEASVSSRLSLTAERKVQAPDTNIEVELPSLFDICKDFNGQKMQPKGVLIRGRAGIGKTTLCEKMVHDLRTSGLRSWNKLFDRVL